MTEALGDRLLAAVLPHVPFDGWSETAFRRAAEGCGDDPAMFPIVFPGGLREAASCLFAAADRRMVEDFRAEAEKSDVFSLSLQGRIALIFELRLQRWSPWKEAFRKASVALMLRGGPAAAAQSVWLTADAAWKAAGDRTSDFSWYAKRASLAAVWAATVLYWSDDRSAGDVETLDFLKRRLASAASAAKARREWSKKLKETVDDFRFFRLSLGRGKSVSAGKCQGNSSD